MSVHVPRHPHGLRTAHDHLDSIGLGKLSEKQMKAVVDMVKARGMLKEPPPECEGRGIVIAAGGKYADYGFVNARWLRSQGIQHPIQIWHLGPKEIPDWSRPHFAKLDVELVDAWDVRAIHRHRKLEGWTTKQFAAMWAPFRHVCFYDADCFAAADPAIVWDDPDYQREGALFFSDIKPCRANNWAYFFAGVRMPDHEMDSGCFFWDRVKAWEGIKFTNWIGEHSEVWDKTIFGDKDRPYLGFSTTKTPFIQSTERTWEGWGIQQSWKGRVIANHAMAAKRGEHRFPHPVIPSFFEEWRSLMP